MAEDGIFIVGCPRSGTTLLQSLLASHSAIASFPESKFFLRLIAEPRQHSQRYRLGLVGPQAKPTFTSFLQDVQASHLAYQIPKLPLIRLYVRAFRQVLTQLTQAQKKQLWLEKTPEHLHYIADIRRYLPRAKFVHILRSGEDTIASLYDLCQRHPAVWGRYFDGLDGCIDRWLRDIEISRTHRHHPGHAVVRYESLVAAPQPQLQRLCSFIGVEFESAMLDRYRDTSSQLIRQGEAWKQLNRQAIRTTSHTKFKTVLTLAQQQRVLDRIKDADLSAFEI